MSIATDFVIRSFGCYLHVTPMNFSFHYLYATLLFVQFIKVKAIWLQVL